MAHKKIESHEQYLKVVEQYKDYEAGTYQSMTLTEKMDFFDGIHTDNVPLFDEDGDEMNTFDDYDAIRDEFLDHPEQFALDNILDFMEMLDDSCYQPSFMDTIVKIIHNIVRFYQLEGVTYLLSHLNQVPRRGYEYGLFWSVRYLINDENVYPIVKESLGQIRSKEREFVLQILEGNTPEGKIPLLAELGNEMEQNRKAELEDIIYQLSDIN